MALQIYPLALAFLVLFALGRIYQYSLCSARPKRFPPGPKTLPFIGNMHQMPIERPHFVFTEYARQFGAVIGFKVGCHNLIVLNTWQAVRDLVEQRGAIYSSRPSIPLCDIVLPKSENPGLSVYGELWRKQRKALVEFLGGDRTDRMKPVQDAESTQMIYDMMNTPANFEHHVDRSFGGIILATVFGQRGKTNEAGSKIAMFFETEEEWSTALGPTAYPPTSSFPFLKRVPEWLTPWKGWKTRAVRIKKKQNQIYHSLLDETRERLKQGKGEECFMSQCLKVQDKQWYDDTYLAYLGGVLLEGGAETSASATMVFLMAMAAFPDVAREAQEEVDRVCGALRIPGGDDIGRLPYVRACMLELLRWRPITPLAVPHTTTADDDYGALTIPNGADILINAWMINNDESFYESPEKFNPSRYMNNEYGCASTVDLEANKGRRVNYTFGAGRRVCPGQRFADNSMMLHFAKVLWAFDINATGSLPISTWGQWTDGVIHRPKSLEIELALRDEGRRAIIEDAWSRADDFLLQFE
ncbi:cytochrome P450 [Ampelomyces quisqualis]|uniref:Cytochrome P450 n=1 Tax=Ampelomyces quisqualis TaxID=50730 RepID=A0A6A5QBE0_AMPQU|nr:cytochrome P450 [Ampelomyces quisqualis]